MNKQAVIIIHEIYGVNEFIKDVCKKMKLAGYDVYCPNLIGKTNYTYDQSSEAYDYFIREVGFDICKSIADTLHEFKEKYEKVFILGFSVGATIAWRCCETQSCDGIVGCYGSRIRDYLNLNPACPTLLIFAKEDSFDVDRLNVQLQAKESVELFCFNAKHGFMDSYSQNYNEQQSNHAERCICEFFSDHKH